MITSHSTRSRRVLITVEDSNVRNMLMVGLEKENCRSVVVKDREEVQRLLTRDSDFRGAIFDMRILGLKDLNILEFMRSSQNLTSIPILMIAAERDLRLMTKHQKTCVSIFLSTPFTVASLQSTLRLLIR